MQANNIPHSATPQLLPTYSGEKQDAVLTCRAGYEQALCAEIAQTLHEQPSQQGEGWLCYPDQVFQRHKPPAFVFERHRMLACTWLPFTRPRRLSQQLLHTTDLQTALKAGLAWRCDCFLLQAQPTKREHANTASP